MNSHRPSPCFIADALGLDFLNAIAPPPSARIPPLQSGDDLVRWLKDARLAPSDALEALQAIAVPGELDAVASQARALGEWFRRFVLERKGKPLPPTAVGELQPLNRVLELDLRFGQVDATTTGSDHRTTSGLTWRSHRQWSSPGSLLLPIAQSMAELVCDEDFGLVRECQGPGCTLLFLDRTRGQARRWCRMATCGNRAKQAARRELPL